MYETQNKLSNSMQFVGKSRATEKGLHLDYTGLDRKMLGLLEKDGQE